MLLVVDAEGTVHGALSAMLLGSALCGFPPRKLDGERWRLTDPGLSPATKGRAVWVTCRWCQAELAT